MKKEILTVSVAGRLYSGSYCVTKDFVAVSLGALRSTAKCGQHEPERIARLVLRRMAQQLADSAARAKVRHA